MMLKKGLETQLFHSYHDKATWSEFGRSAGKNKYLNIQQKMNTLDLNYLLKSLELHKKTLL